MDEQMRSPGGEAAAKAFRIHTIKDIEAPQHYEECENYKLGAA